MPHRHRRPSTATTPFTCSRTARRPHLASFGLLTVLALVLALSLSSCSGAPSAAERGPIAVHRAPQADLVLPATDAEGAIAASAALFASAHVAVLSDPGSVGQAGELAQSLGVPVFLVENAEAQGTKGALAAEFERLGVQHTLLVGTAKPAWLSGGADEYPPAAGRESAQSGSAAQPAGTDQPAQTGPTHPAPTDIHYLPATTTAAFPVITDGANPATLATVRAAGGAVVESGPDPRASSATIQALAGRAAAVASFGVDLPNLSWQLAAARTGTELPGGGQLVLEGKRYVALYGSPVTAALGVLGEQGVEETATRAAEHAQPYRALTQDTVIPAMELIVTVAAGAAGDDGNYSHEWDPDIFVPYIEAAARHGQYVVLDFQPGRSSFPEQVKRYEKLLRYPNVGIALDPEWRLGPEDFPLERIGHVEIAEVNETVRWLADFVRENQLPQKVVILHQFQVQMLRDVDQLDQSRAEVALVIHADGQGSQAAKQDTWRTLHSYAPAGVAWGWKNFYDEDKPMLTPEETYTQVEPMPAFVSYQ
ncbi:hypothetical protein [Actinotignum schaalii]|uniref:hypothetical protein n=1 Tax=Actinotignum schaalii TaxID=59505 RepID=UPI000405954D|nr:hypothetical protein [Actinotignum schaalii]WQN44935.1 hypothetical protein U4A90_08075 [Actinotignum schaalii]